MVSRRRDGLAGHDGAPRRGLPHTFLGACLLLVVVGCSGLPRKNDVPEYTALRESVEASSPAVTLASDQPDDDAVADQRLEGRSAEEASGASNVLARIGLKKEPRKDIRQARELYAQAEQLFAAAKELTGEARKQRFREAARQFDRAAANWRSSALEQDALMMAAESLFFAEDYYDAEQKYAQLLKEYPRNPYLDHIDSRRFEIADYWLRVGHAERKPFTLVNLTDDRFPWNDLDGHGKRVLEKLRLDNPTGKVSDDATMRLAMELYDSGKWEEAAEAFSDLRISYPDSEHLFNAMFLETMCRLQSYQGPRYSSEPLTQAQDLIKRLFRQFPEQAKNREQELKEAYVKTRYLMAERIWTQAQYRRARQENGSARFHYQRLIEQYRDTPFAEQAQEQLAAIQDAPADPPQRFKALVWLFQAEVDDRPWREKETAGDGS
ncbi:MAG: hypothetical protein KatS3mg111_1455 [Pirellulaceae bacterium]|nr:MAG: hypothetical protein KatS3mg111_1455 [Pirellulaceae bacterium]